MIDARAFCLGGQLKLLTPSSVGGIAHNYVISSVLFCVVEHFFSVLGSASQTTCNNNNEKTRKCEVAHVRSVQVLVTRLHDRGFLFLVSSVQMAPPAGETGERTCSCNLSSRKVVFQIVPPFFCVSRERGQLEEVSPSVVCLPRVQRRGQTQ